MEVGEAIDDAVFAVYSSGGMNVPSESERIRNFVEAVAAIAAITVIVAAAIYAKRYERQQPRQPPVLCACEEE